MGLLDRITTTITTIEKIKEDGLVKLENAAIYAEERREKNKTDAKRIQKIKEGFFGKSHSTIDKNDKKYKR